MLLKNHWLWPRYGGGWSLEVIYTENAFGTPNGDRWVEVSVQTGDRPRQVILYIIWHFKIKWKNEWIIHSQVCFQKNIWPISWEVNEGDKKKLWIFFWKGYQKRTQNHIWIILLYLSWNELAITWCSVLQKKCFFL